MMRCCSGETYVQPNGSSRRTTSHPVEMNKAHHNAWRGQDLDPETENPSWAVLCWDCDRVLAVVDCPREEVYADL